MKHFLFQWRPACQRIVACLATLCFAFGLSAETTTLSATGWGAVSPRILREERQAEVSHLVATVLAAVAEAPQHGLSNGRYGRSALAEIAGELAIASFSYAELSDAERLASRSLLAYLVDLRFGSNRVGDADVAEVETAVAAAIQTDAVDELLAAFVPTHDGYRALQSHLQELLAIELHGGWVVVGAGPTLDAESSGDRVARLRQRLGLESPLEDDVQYDDELMAAVERYQALHGLDADGLAGRRTIAHLDTTVRQRIEQVTANLARWRQSSLPTRGDFVHVNVPEYRLTYFRENAEDVSMRVIVGEKDNQTPVFSDEIEYLVFSPYWNVPRSITVNELLPKFAGNPESLSRDNFEVVGQDGVIAADSLDFSDLDPQSFPYRLRQKPGRKNSLGLVKFIFPNDYSVYLHDTPANSLFERARRALSHGCVRVEQPELLAEALLDSLQEWPLERVQRAMSGRRPDHVWLPTPVPVHITYFTAATSVEGELRLLEDVYERDQRMQGLLASERLDLTIDETPLQLAMAETAQ